MGNGKRLIIGLLTVVAAVGVARADDTGLVAGVEASKRVNKRVSAGVEAELRTRNDFRTVDRVSVGASVQYKPLKFLKLAAGYSLLIDNNEEHLTYNDDGSYNNWRPGYYGTRHRVNVSATGEYKPTKRLKLSLRERWQYTYRGERDDVRRYDFDNLWWETVTVRAKHKHVLRSRLQVEYDFPKWKFDPTLSVEFFNALSLQKTRLTLGTEYSITKRHAIGAFYRWQIESSHDDEGAEDRHLVGVNYTFKF